MNHGKESQNDKECDDVTGLSAKCMTSLISLVKRIGTGVCHDGHSHKTLVLVDSKVTNLKIQPYAINACVNSMSQSTFNVEILWLYFMDNISKKTIHNNQF